VNLTEKERKIYKY